MPPGLSNLGWSAAGSAVNMGLNLIQGAGSGLINNLFYRRNLDLQVEAQKDLIDYQNQYNSPTAQMQRLSEAGLNPNLVYGSQAPAGQSGNASAPSGVANPGNYNTASVIQGMLQLEQMKAAEAQKNDLNASANLKNSEAEKNRLYLTRYPELLEIEVRRGTKDLQRIASEIDLNYSSNALNTAKSHLATAQEALTRGEISLQEYQKQKLVAETMAFIASSEERSAHTSLLSEMTNTQKAETLIKRLELSYQRLLKGSPSKMSSLARAEYDSKMAAFKLQAKQAAAQAGIKGNKFVAFLDWYLGHVEKASGTVREANDLINK